MGTKIVVPIHVDVLPSVVCSFYRRKITIVGLDEAPLQLQAGCIQERDHGAFDFAVALPSPAHSPLRNLGLFEEFCAARGRPNVPVGRKPQFLVTTLVGGPKFMTPPFGRKQGAGTC